MVYIWITTHIQGSVSETVGVFKLFLRISCRKREEIAVLSFFLRSSCQKPTCRWLGKLIVVKDTLPPVSEDVKQKLFFNHSLFGSWWELFVAIVFFSLNLYTNKPLFCKMWSRCSGLCYWVLQEMSLLVRVIFAYFLCRFEELFLTVSTSLPYVSCCLL